MIVWLASYPRSGNTFLRMVLKRVCRVPSYSIYDETPLSVGADGLEEVKEGDAGDVYDAERVYTAARDSSRLHLMKTHDTPQDDSPAIYIERDGRAACVSYYHYLKEFENPDVTMTDVVLGRVHYPSWSEHYESWRPLERPNTLLIRFEELTRSPDDVIAHVGRFLGLSPQRPYGRDFAYLHQMAPRFFRKGDNEANIAELGSEDAALFWTMHGRLMKERGYANSIPPVAPVTRELLIDLRDRWTAILADRHRKNLAEIEADRAERGAINEQLQAQMQAVEADQMAKGDALAAAAVELRAIDADRKAKHETIAALTDELVVVDGDRRAKDAVIARLTAELEVLGADHRARGAVIERLVEEIGQVKKAGR